MNVFASLIERPKFVAPPKPAPVFVRREKKPKPSPANNPWKLTHAECTTLDVLAETGCGKLAAEMMSVSHRTVENSLAVIKRKMGVSTRLLAVLMWDRHIRRLRAMT
jgi:DNA-binding NarL/FixJ family response regulator